MLQAVKKSECKRSNGLSSEEKADASQMARPTQKTDLQLQRAIEMYGLTGSELFCEVKRDTRCLMGWNDSTIVLAFRGTASMTNALSDLQVSHFSCPKYTALSLQFSLKHLSQNCLKVYDMCGTSLPATRQICTKHLQHTVWWVLCEAKRNWAVAHKQICCNRSCSHVQQSCTCFSACGLRGFGCNRHCISLQCRQPMFPLKTHRCGHSLENLFCKLVAADHCLTEHATSMTRLFGIVAFDLAGLESSTPPCQRPPSLLLSAPCSCRLPAELAGWRLQHKGCQPHHGNGEPAPAWPRSAEDLHHRWVTTELFLL